MQAKSHLESVVTADQDRTRRAGHITVRGGANNSSTWQSLTRGTGVETDYLTGEIVLLGRLHRVPTPVNDLLQRLASRMAAEGRPPGSVAAEDVLARLAL